MPVSTKVVRSESGMRRGVFDTKTYDKAGMWLAGDLWFSQIALIHPLTDHHDITEICRKRIKQP